MDEALDDSQGALNARLTAFNYCPFNHRSKLLLQNNVGNTYKELNMLDSARFYYLSTINQTENSKYLIVPYQGMGEIYLAENNYEEAISSLNKSIKHAEEMNNLPLLNHSKLLLGKTYYLAGRSEEAKKVFSEVSPYKNEPFFKIDEKVNFGKYSILSELALKNKKLESELTGVFSDFDTLHNINREKELKNLVFQFKNRILADSLNNLKITALNQELNLKTQRQAMYSVIGLIILVSIIAGLLFRQNKIRKKANTLLQQKNREILHRTKNNLTMLSVFMRQEARKLENQEAKAAVMEAENRLQTIAIIDRKLNAQNDQAINISEYLSELTQNLKSTYSEKGKPMSLKLNIDELKLDAENAAWIGLIVNELMTNSIKYAFADKEFPEIKISLSQNSADQLFMRFKDNGVGLTEKIDLQKAKSYGQRLIRNLTTQMNGKMQTLNNDGLEYQFYFQLPKIIN